MQKQRGDLARAAQLIEETGAAIYLPALERTRERFIKPPPDVDPS